MKQIILLSFVFGVLNIKVNGQSNIVANDISFIYNANDATKVYSCGVVFHNSSYSSVKIYSSLAAGDKNDKFSNCIIELEGKIDGVFKRTPWYFSNPSVAAHIYPQLNFDLERVLLQPNQSQTIFIDEQMFKFRPINEIVTQYRFKIKVRLDFQYPGTNPDPGGDGMDNKKILYKESDWFYFLPQ
jgi:hypothetical protein